MPFLGLNREGRGTGLHGDSDARGLMPRLNRNSTVLPLAPVPMTAQAAEEARAHGRATHLNRQCIELD